MDNDGDGWTDTDDPDCSSTTQLWEDGGFTGGTQYNDSADNDEDGLTDAQDPGCEDGYDDEEEDPSTECNDEIDNDADGWTDLDDPVCRASR